MCASSHYHPDPHPHTRIIIALMLLALTPAYGLLILACLSLDLGKPGSKRVTRIEKGSKVQQ